MSEFEIGSILINRYRIEAKLGEGGMAVVYQAYDLKRQVKVAIKALKADYAEDENFLHRFRREARNLRRLQHPNIVRFYEFTEAGILAFMVLDYIDGMTLRRIMRQRGKPFSPGEVLGYLRPICAALYYAHGEGVIHCDMKPANVMVDSRGGVYLSDFGIARLGESATVTFSTPGTAAYMAPEQWRGGEEVHAATDVYALGILLYEMLTGRQPFTGETIQTRGNTRDKVMREHFQLTPPSASQLNRQLPPAFDAILLKCLAKNADGRYQGADQLLREFQATCSQLGLMEVPVVPPAVAPMENAAIYAPPQPNPPSPMVQGGNGLRKAGVLAGVGVGWVTLMCGGMLVLGVGLFVFGPHLLPGVSTPTVFVEMATEAISTMAGTPDSPPQTDTAVKTLGPTDTETLRPNTATPRPADTDTPQPTDTEIPRPTATLKLPTATRVPPTKPPPPAPTPVPPTATRVPPTQPPPPPKSGHGIAGSLWLCNSRTTYAAGERICFWMKIVNPASSTVSYGVLGVKAANMSGGSSWFQSSWTGSGHPDDLLSIDPGCTGPKWGCSGPWDDGFPLSAGTYQLTLSICYSKATTCQSGGDWETLTAPITIVVQ